jgi:hypothetical protein
MIIIAGCALAAGGTLTRASRVLHGNGPLACAAAKAALDDDDEEEDDDDDDREEALVCVGITTTSMSSGSASESRQSSVLSNPARIAFVAGMHGRAALQAASLT